MILTANYDLKMPVSGAILQLEWNSVGSYQGTGTTWFDKSGNQNDFIITGSVGGGRPTWSYVDGFNFEGSNTTTNRMFMSCSQAVRSRLNAPISASNEYTVMVDAYLNYENSRQEICSFFTGETDDFWGKVSLNTTTSYVLENACRTTGGGYLIARCSTGVNGCYTTNQRTVLSSTFRSGDGTRIWNGTTSKAQSGTTTGTLRSGTGPLWSIGMDTNYGSYNQFPFQGRLFGVWAFSRRLSDSELSQMVTYINNLH